MGYITKTSDYWIAPNAVTITLNALGEANRIQGSVASGAVISCYIETVKPGGDNGDGLQLDNGRNPKRWPLLLSPTYFNSDKAKYVYAAIPRSATIGSQAMIVFPSEQIDIYGKNGAGEQIGSADYFYVYLNGIISAVYTDEDNAQRRRWTKDPKENWGTLGTYEDIVTKDADWYHWDAATQLTTFLKNLTMQDGTTFLKLFAEDVQAKIIHGVRQLVFGSGEGAQPLTGVAVSPDDDEATDKIVTPAYLDEFGNTRYLSKVHDDTAAGLITFLQGLVSGTYHRDAQGNAGDTGAKIFPDGTGDFLNLIFSSYLKSKGARSGFLDGTGILMDAEKGKIEADGMEVRGFLKVMELIINRLQLMESDYSFTEGDTTERVDFSNEGQRMVLTMHKEHDNDHTPFYPGDILYAKVNNLLDHGTYYTCWVRVVSVDLTNNTIKVAPYPALKQSGELYVPVGTNFTFLGTEIDDEDFTDALLQDYTAYPDGYEKILNLTRHGNVADGLLDGDDPTSYSDKVLESQKGRQQAWVLSTTDKRLSFFWNVDEPIVRDENYALCLGILPDLANLPSTRNKAMPSLYVNTIFYDYQHRANYPARVVKEDRGQWVAPDSTIPQPTAATADGTDIYDPYHFRTYTRVTWQQYRNSRSWASLTDAELHQKMMEEFKVDLEVSRVWNHGALWECLVDGTTQEPTPGCTDWQLVSGGTFSLGFYTDGDDPMPIMGLAVRPGNINETVVPYLLFGQEDISQMVTAWRWERESQYEALDEAWGNSARVDDADPTSALKSRTRTLHITNSDMPANWEANDGRVGFKCTAYFLMDGEEAEIMNRISIV